MTIGNIFQDVIQKSGTGAITSLWPVEGLWMKTDARERLGIMRAQSFHSVRENYEQAPVNVISSHNICLA